MGNVTIFPGKIHFFQTCMPNLPTPYAACSAPLRTNLTCWIRLELFITILARSVPLIILVKLKDHLEKGSVNIREIPLLWVLTAKSPSTLLTRNNSRSWTQTRDGTKEASRKPYIHCCQETRLEFRIWDATHSRKPTRNWSSHVAWGRPLSRYPGHVTRPVKRQPAITNISAEEVISDETQKFHVSFL